VVSHSEQIGFAILEVIVHLEKDFTVFGLEDGQLGASHRHDVVSGLVDQPADDPVGLIGVCGKDQSEAVQVACQGDVIHALMGLAIFSDVQPHVSEHHLQIAVVDVVEPLHVIHFRDAKHAKIRPEGLDPAAGQSARHYSGVVLHDPALEETLRKSGGKIVGLDAGSEVAIEYHDGSGGALVDLSQVGNGISPGAAVVCVFFIHNRLTALQIGFEGKAHVTIPADGQLCLLAQSFESFKPVGLAQLLQCCVKLFGIQGGAVIFGQILHKVHPLSHHGVGQHHHRFILPAGLFQGLEDLLKIMSVYFQNRPTVRFPISADVLRHHLMDGAADLQTVVVYDGAEV